MRFEKLLGVTAAVVEVSDSIVIEVTLDEARVVKF
jgi:hypothetical protein